MYGLFQKLEAPPKGQTYFKLKIWEFLGSNFDLKNGNSKKCFKKWEFPIFYVKNSFKKWELTFFVLKMIEDFGNSHVFFTLATKKVLIWGRGNFP